MSLIGVLFVPGYYALSGSRTPEAKPIIHATPIHATPAPTPKELVRIYDVVKLNRPEIGDAEAWKVSDAILEESAKHNLDPILIAALIEVESGFQSAAISPMGARGIMQIMPEVGRAIAREVGLREDSGYDAFRPEHLDDPVLNIKLGIYYLYGLKKIFRSLNHALVAYNVGPTAMRNHLENETEVPIEFANAVLSVYRKYQTPKQPAF
ncbi:MAG TPA: lytic transglycosylase domain-containing protein [Candidatus Binatia bacterium]|nr:lytic transglycosylase domain-containing protein [Candidatus Binatia bacterium]